MTVFGAKNVLKLVLIAVILIVGLMALSRGYWIFFVYFLVVSSLELFSFILVKVLKKDFPWLITPDDEFPKLDKGGLRKFIEHGYDQEIGWIRKPNTQKEEIGKFGKTKYSIDARGSRKNPCHEGLPKKISFYGDSFIFGRQANDDETFQWYLSKLTRTNVLNFSVGNYGLDQALLRLKREYPRNKTKVVVMGVVPSTIVRILSVWKHYNEFGNTFGFKPRFIIQKGKLKLIENFIDSEDKFEKYERYLPEIRHYDYFYKTKFKAEMLRFPYFISIISKPMRNIPLILLVLKSKWLCKEEKPQVYPAPMRVIMKINLKLRHKIFTKDKNSVKLLKMLVEEFAKYVKAKGATPVFLWMPQKDDLLFIKGKKIPYYQEFIESIHRDVSVIDLTKYLCNRNDLDDIFSDDTKYGGHYSRLGNKLVAKIIYKELKGNSII